MYEREVSKAFEINKFETSSERERGLNILTWNNGDYVVVGNS